MLKWTIKFLPQSNEALRIRRIVLGVESAIFHSDGAIDG